MKRLNPFQLPFGWLYHCIQLVFFILCTTPRLFGIQIQNLGQSFEMILKIDRVLDKIPTQIPCTTQRLTVVGIIYVYVHVNYGILK